MQLPNEFLKHVREFAGGEYDAFIKSLDDPATVAIRLNPYKPSDLFETNEKIPWSANGRYLAERPSFTFDPLFHAGCYYVQDASSQFLEQAFKIVREEINGALTVLDLCAAPGGKSTHLLSLMGEKDILISNEIIPSRNSILRENIMKWGLPNVIVTQNDSSDLLRCNEMFNVIVIDAPCSGEGLFRKDKNAINEWSEQNVARCIVRQKEITENAFEALCPGGFLIYSTCTFEEGENDDQVKRMVEEMGMELIEMKSNYEGVRKTDTGLIFYPHLVRGEGFFIALLKKRGESISVNIKSDRKKSHEIILENYISNHQDFYVVKKEERIFAIPLSHAGVFKEISQNLYVRHAGIFIGEEKARDIIPSAALALSINVKPDINSVDVDYTSAIQFLRGEPVSPSSEKGWQIVKYKGFNLGWIKNIGNRVNNYYPKEWRIRNSMAEASENQ